MLRALTKSEKSIRRIKRLAGILDEENRRVFLTRAKHGHFSNFFLVLNNFQIFLCYRKKYLTKTELRLIENRSEHTNITLNKDQ